jgi:hypothetical protein
VGKWLIPGAGETKNKVELSVNGLRHALRKRVTAGTVSQGDTIEGALANLKEATEATELFSNSFLSMVQSPEASDHRLPCVFPSILEVAAYAYVQHQRRTETCDALATAMPHAAVHDAVAIARQ